VRIDVDASLVQRYVLDLARHGAYGETGVWRTAYSPEWVAAQEQVASWYAEAGLDVRRDAVGNVWGRLASDQPGPVIASGSHIDSQTPGGRYDGALGVIGALVALRTLHERFGRPRRTLEAVSLCEEEASRFHATNFWGSRAVTGRIAADEPERIRDFEGVSIAEAMRAVGLDPTRIAEAARDDVETWVELHIEQGPILEAAGLPVGVVHAITAIRHYVVELVGRSDHAGARPMDGRLDPMAGAAEIVTAVIGVALEMGPPAVTTVGRMRVEPNLPSAVADKVVFTVDSRHPDRQALQELHARQERLMIAIAERRGLQISWSTPLDLPPVSAIERSWPCLSKPPGSKTFRSFACTAALPMTRRTWPRSRRSRWCSSRARTAAATHRRSSRPSTMRSLPFACSLRRCTSWPTDRFRRDR
jgi:allantoate deiminase